MFRYIFLTFSVIGLHFLPSQSVSPLKAPGILTPLQSQLYSYVKKILSTTDLLAEELYFVHQNLQDNAATFFANLADEEVALLPQLESSCEQNAKCRACFDSPRNLSAILDEATTRVTQYLSKEKVDYDDAVADIQRSIKENAFLAAEAYEKYKESENFQADVESLYGKLQAALDLELNLFERTVRNAIDKIVNFNVEVSIDTEDTITEEFNRIIGCIEEAINNGFF